MRRISAVFLALGLVAGAAAMSAAGAGSSPRSITLRLVEKQVGFNFIDNPPHQGRDAPPLMGDQFVFTNELLTRSGAHAGFLDATCTVTRGGNRGAGTCYGTFFLKGGQLAGIKFGGSGADQIAVVGGTGVYEGVTGSIVSRSRGDNSPFSDDTIHLLFP